MFFSGFGPSATRNCLCFKQFHTAPLYIRGVQKEGGKHVQNL